MIPAFFLVASSLNKLSASMKNINFVNVLRHSAEDGGSKSGEKVLKESGEERNLVKSSQESELKSTQRI